MVFPTLSQKPSVELWAERIAKDPTIRTDFENGFEQTYPAFTRITKEWDIGYNALPTADKNTLQNFEKSVKCGSMAFSWRNPVDNVVYTVRFAKPVTYKMLTSQYWTVEFTLREV